MEILLCLLCFGAGVFCTCAVLAVLSRNGGGNIARAAEHQESDALLAQYRNFIEYDGSANGQRPLCENERSTE